MKSIGPILTIVIIHCFFLFSNIGKIHAQSSQIFFLPADTGAQTTFLFDFTKNKFKNIDFKDSLIQASIEDTITCRMLDKKRNFAYLFGRLNSKNLLLCVDLLNGTLVRKYDCCQYFNCEMVYDNTKDIGYGISSYYNGRIHDSLFVFRFNPATNSIFKVGMIPQLLSIGVRNILIDEVRGKFFFQAYDPYKDTLNLCVYSILNDKINFYEDFIQWGIDFDKVQNRLYGFNGFGEFGWTNANNPSSFNVLSTRNKNYYKYQSNFNGFINNKDNTYTTCTGKIIMVYDLKSGNLKDSINTDLNLSGDYVFANESDMITKEVSGRIYFDINTNGMFDSNDDYTLPNVRVERNGNNASTFTDEEGLYHFYADSGKSTFSCYPPKYTDSVKPASIDLNISLSNTSYHDNDFIVYRKKISDLQVNLNSVTILRPQNKFQLIITCTNAGTIPEKGEVKLSIPSGLKYISSSKIPDSTAAGFITWTTSKINSAMTEVILVNFQSDSNLKSDTTKTFIASIKNTSDLNKENDLDTLIAKVRTSYDPNEKTVFPPEGNTLPGKDLKYSIHFQNTGNDTAFKVVLMDTLSTLLDLKTFHFIASSHKAVYDIVGRTLRVSFNDIMLPDSTTNQVESNGYFFYSITPISTALLGSNIKNTAHIFFDYNSPVATNTTSNILAVSTSIADNEKKNEAGILAYPNPTSGMLHIKIPEGNKITHLQVLNAAGQLIYQTFELTNEFELSLANQPAGLYILRLTNQNGVPVGRVLVSKMD